MLSTISPVADRTNSLDTSATFQDPMLVVIWIAIGILGLLAGIVAVSIADRRRRSDPTRRVDALVLTRAEAELLSAA